MTEKISLGLNSVYFKKLYIREKKYTIRNLNKVKKMIKKFGENYAWNNYINLKTAKKLFENDLNSMKKYEDWLKNHYISLEDLAIAYYEYSETSYIIYYIMNHLGCTYGDARNYHYYNFIGKLEQKYKEIMNGIG